ncbi:MAG: NUDIX hydrolase [Candidatus Pacearchaeota archaeon]|jgi:ADP-ribose pyrophosphatase YjhB (NUDIX family)
MNIKYFLAKPLFNILQFKFAIGGVPVIIQNSKKEILLGKRTKNMITYPEFWGLPGGIIDYNELSEKTAIREVKEELGVDIKIVKKSKIIYENPPKKECSLHSINIVYYAKIIKGEPKPLNETSEIKWFKPSEIKKINLAYNHKEILQKEGLLK